MKKDNCALVLGGYVNGYSIIQELHEKGVCNIVLFDTSKRIASASNRIRKFVLINEAADNLYAELKKLHEEYDQIIIFPTDDLQLENLNEIYSKTHLFCFLPFNHRNLAELLDKYQQYQYCAKLGVPYPQTVRIKKSEEIDKVLSLRFPVLIKPNKREDMKSEVFRNLEIRNSLDLEKKKRCLTTFISKGLMMMASEIIPGDGSNIYAYVGYRNKKGRILNEWTGKKLSQFPHDFGVFASASNQAPKIVLEQGRVLLEGMNIYGIAEPEFKYDHRDGKYKLMEVNLRSMMWHRAGNLSGVNIQYTQYLDAIGKKSLRQKQTKYKDIHFVCLKHEILNLLRRKRYLKTFLNNIFNSDKTYVAVFDRRDIKPFLMEINSLINSLRPDVKSTR